MAGISLSHHWQYLHHPGSSHALFLFQTAVPGTLAGKLLNHCGMGPDSDCASPLSLKIQVKQLTIKPPEKLVPNEEESSGML